jgi:hypothetical protein
LPTATRQSHIRARPNCPRWNDDINFTTILVNVRIIPQIIKPLTANP